jgi:tetratricopeptide (TPR) repeat protein
MLPVQQDWEKGEFTRVLDVLDTRRPLPGEPDLRRWEWHHQWRLSHADLRTFTGQTGEITSLAFSPDGQLLASARRGSVKLWEAATGKEKATFQERFREEQDPNRYAGASRALAGQSGLPAACYRQALRQAETATRLAPGSGPCLTALGIAQYRMGRYEEALPTLKRAEQVNVEQGGFTTPADLAFLAMSQQQLGHKDEARAGLGRLRDLLKRPASSTARRQQGHKREKHSHERAPASDLYLGCPAGPEKKAEGTRHHLREDSRNWN